MDKYKLGGLTELGQGVEHEVGHRLYGPILKMGGPSLLYLLVSLEGVCDRAEDLHGSNHQEHLGLSASWRRAFDFSVSWQRVSWLCDLLRVLGQLLGLDLGVKVVAQLLEAGIFWLGF